MAERPKGRPWARVPVEALEDRRLSPTEFRVLVTLLTYADGDTGWTWPTHRSTIAARCGVSPQNISRATAALVRYGWIQKFGNGGNSCPAKYKFNSPLTRPESGQVIGNTRPESGQVIGNTRPESDTNTRPESGQRKEQTSFHITDATSKAAAPAGEPDQIAPDPVRFDGVRWAIDDAVFDSWITGYANGRTHQDTEDWIEAELAKASVWLQANPRKHKKNYLRFLTGWLTRSADSMRIRGQRQARPYH